MVASSVSTDAESEGRLGGVSFERGRSLGRRAHELIPGGAHTYAKGDDQYPEQSPAFIVRGKGCHVWDMDGNEFIEYGMGLRAVTLGHAFPSVVDAAARQMQLGTNFVRPAPIEVECAERFLELIPTADMVKFGKHGSDALDGAVRLARAHTGRDYIAICGDQPFFLDVRLVHRHDGDAARGTRMGSVSNREISLQRPCQRDQPYSTIIRRQIACVLLEPARLEEPAEQFLSRLKELCNRNGALLVFDEMVTGFRWHRSGAQHVYGVTPDLSTFGKGLANGFALSALAGRREVMELGGYDHDRERVFLMSTTHGAETHAMAAGIASMSTYRDEDVVGHLSPAGQSPSPRRANRRRLRQA